MKFSRQTGGPPIGQPPERPGHITYFHGSNKTEIGICNELARYYKVFK